MRPLVRDQGPFAALRHHNYRRLFYGQSASMTGSWLQQTAQMWLVLVLTNSPVLLGLINALQFGPVLIFSLFAGAIVDRMPRRTVLIVVQSTLMGLSLIMAILVLTGVVRYWHVAILAILLGIAKAFDNPARQSFIVELVDRRDLMNAVALHSTLINGTRIFGPALAGVLIAQVGIGWAFLLNTLSFLGILYALIPMRVAPRPREEAERRRVLEDVIEGVRYARATPAVLSALVLLGGLSMFALNFSVLVPVLARTTLGQGAQGYGLLMAALGTGGTIGALSLASASHLGPQPRYFYGGVVVLAFTYFLIAANRNVPFAAALLLMAGWAMITCTATANTMIQSATPDALRGRVMGLHSFVFIGVTPFGALFTGTIAERWGAPTAFAVAGAMAMVIVISVAAWRRRMRVDAGLATPLTMGAPRPPEAPVQAPNPPLDEGAPETLEETLTPVRGNGSEQTTSR